MADRSEVRMTWSTCTTQATLLTPPEQEPLAMWLRQAPRPSTRSKHLPQVPSPLPLSAPALSASATQEA
jgi:hypothetical protein